MKWVFNITPRNLINKSISKESMILPNPGPLQAYISEEKGGRGEDVLEAAKIIQIHILK